MPNEDLRPGLGKEPKSEWISISPADINLPPVDRLRPKSELHEKILNYLLERLTASERAMGSFYSRWRANEIRAQAYIDLPDWEQKLKEMNDKGKPSKVVAVTIPYSYATLQTIVTYLIHTFAGRKPIFQVGSHKKETVANARMMELVLQYNADHSRLIKHLFQYLNDGELYGVGILINDWVEERKMRTSFKDQPRFSFLNNLLGTDSIRTREERLVYQGNEPQSCDPFMFFPDPNVPMCEVNRKGEYVFWRRFIGKHELKRAEGAGDLKWIDAIGTIPINNERSQESARQLLSRGMAHPGGNIDLKSDLIKNFNQIDRCTIEILPAELGLGESEKVEKWMFTIANRQQIIQAERFDFDHDMHPVSVIEPSSLGYGFGQAGTADYLGPIQDTISWLVTSHMDNVKTALNNMWVVDPSMIEMQDLKEPGPGKIIRIKRAAQGGDVRTMLQQLGVQDVTRAHIQDTEMFSRFGDVLFGTTDNLKGLQDAGGRKTATEVRTSGEAAASRLASRARLISAQGLVDLSEMQSLNLQQLLEMEFYLSIVGQQGIDTPLKADAEGGIGVTPESLTGDFHYPIHDGTLPLDRVALLDVWKEIFVAVAQDPELRGSFSLTKIFEFLADLGGAKNLEAMKVDVSVKPDQQVQDAAAAGNAVPVGAAGTSPSLPSNPGSRVAGAP
ncbi:MAG: hypothetical protein BMS9Abin11_1751 [Gammaproteobacteria bacterium]|nr:MAG: hypothetical protein BMS9Abin11_1751 [Gammaproteobacteria bacterium]